jgi:hypothetical protein
MNSIRAEYDDRRSWSSDVAMDMDKKAVKGHHTLLEAG